MGIEEQPGPADHLDVHLHGTFAQADAFLLHAILSRVAPVSPVRVDFHDVRTFHDAALSLLAQELSASYGPNVELVGLSEHHHRLLRYLTRAGR